MTTAVRWMSWQHFISTTVFFNPLLIWFSFSFYLHGIYFCHEQRTWAKLMQNNRDGGKRNEETLQKRNRQNDLWGMRGYRWIFRHRCHIGKTWFRSLFCLGRIRDPGIYRSCSHYPPGCAARGKEDHYVIPLAREECVGAHFFTRKFLCGCFPFPS